MANYYLIRLSVYPYIRKYLLHHYPDPFFVHFERGYFPSFLRNALEPIPKQDPAEISKVKKIDYGADFGFNVSTINGNSKKIRYLSGTRVREINEALSDLIHEEMYRFIVQTSGFVRVDKAIRDFQRFYDFTEDELPFENLKRWYYRERKRIESRRLSPTQNNPDLVLNLKGSLTLKQEKQAFECIVKKIAS